jgi:hypothetical protein
MTGARRRRLEPPASRTGFGTGSLANNIWQYLAQATQNLLGYGCSRRSPLASGPLAARIWSRESGGQPVDHAATDRRAPPLNLNFSLALGAP